jgi:hypothetical protein
MPLFFVALFICYMNDTGNQQDRACDTDRLALALSAHIGERCIDAGYTFRISRALTEDNITLIYVRNYGNNITWFNFSPGVTKIDQILIGRISSLKMNVPADFKANPHYYKRG